MFRVLAVPFRSIAWLLIVLGTLLLAATGDCQTHAGDASEWTTVPLGMSNLPGLTYTLALSWEADSALTVGVDTMTTEKGWCLVARNDREHRVLYIDSVYAPSWTSAYPDSVSFGCADQVPIAHLHLLSRGHVAGPSPFDFKAIVHLDVDQEGHARVVHDRPFGLVVIRQLDPKYVRFAVFGLAP